MRLTYTSVCSGIESASVAWEPLGLVPAYFAEIEAFPSAVLAYHWPHVPNVGDMTVLPEAVRAGVLPATDILVGGTPCQAFSVAGLRQGLADDRGQLTIKFVELADAIDEQRDDGCVVVWENVPGVLSSKDNAFGCFLGALAGEDEAIDPSGKKWTNAGCVYGPKRAIAWRILDAQYFGVAQRRRRVFVVASSRKGFDPAKVLFESEGVRRDTPPSREAGQETPGSIGTCVIGSSAPELAHALNTANGGKGSSEDGTGRGVPTVYQPDSKKWPADLACTLNAAFGNKLGLEDQHINGGAPLFVADVSPAVSTGAPFSKTGNERVEADALVAFSAKDNGADATNGLSPTLRAGNANKSHANSGNWMAVATSQHVRRLTPTECERLQGFPDNHTLLPFGTKQRVDADMHEYYERQLQRPLSEDEYRALVSDGPRYKALGNSKAVPAIRWLGARLIAHYYGAL